MKFPNLKSDTRFLELVTDVFEKIEREQIDNILKAADVCSDAIAKDKLVHAMGTGGHTNLPMQEMFLRAGGFACLDGILDVGFSHYAGGLRAFECERTVGYAKGTLKTGGFRFEKGEPIIIFNNIGVNAATIDAALTSKELGLIVIAVSSRDWQEKVPKNHYSRHPSRKNLFDIADICIDDYNPYGDACLEIEGCEASMGSASSMADFYIAHRIQIETAKKLVARGITPPVYKSGNIPGGYEYDEKLFKKYQGRIRYL